MLVEFLNFIQTAVSCVIHHRSLDISCAQFHLKEMSLFGQCFLPCLLVGGCFGEQEAGGIPTASRNMLCCSCSTCSQDGGGIRTNRSCSNMEPCIKLDITYVNDHLVSLITDKYLHTSATRHHHLRAPSWYFMLHFQESLKSPEGM